MTVDELLVNGTLMQDPDNTDKVIYNVPVYMPKGSVDAGGFQLFASHFGWQPDAPDATPDEIAANSVYRACDRIIGQC